MEVRVCPVALLGTVTTACRINSYSAYATRGRAVAAGLAEEVAAEVIGPAGYRSRRLVQALERAILWRGGGPRERRSLALVRVR